ncbi:hypothetical protein V5799_021650, partial [Amblyomma americanum]
MSVEVVNSTAAVVTWRALEPAKLLSGDGNDRLIMSAEYHGLKTASSTYNIIIGTLKPWTYYMASLQDCSAKHCIEVGNRTFLTPPDHPSWGPVLEVHPRNFTAVLQLKNIGVKGFEVKGRCGEDWEIRYEKSMHQQGALDNDQYIQVQ